MRVFALLLFAGCVDVPVREVARAPVSQSRSTESTATIVASPPHEEAAPRDVVDAAVRDPRQSTRAPRSPKLVQTEAQGLENLLSVTPLDARDRPLIRRRLAEDYVELRKGGVLGASAMALAQYEAILHEAPEDPRLDEVLYFSALEREASGDLAGARRAYFDVIMKTRRSRYVPYVYYAFGHMFFEEAASDSTKYLPALQAFEEALSHRESPVAPEAAYQIVHLFTAQGDPARATAMRERLARDFPTSEAARRMSTAS
jgi:TolA-binding protein